MQTDYTVVTDTHYYPEVNCVTDDEEQAFRRYEELVLAQDGFVPDGGVEIFVAKILRRKKIDASGG